VNGEVANTALRAAEELLIGDLIVAEFLVGLARKVKLSTLCSNLQSRCRRRSISTLPRDIFGGSRGPGGTLRRPGSLPSSRSPVILRTLDAIQLVLIIAHEAPIATLDGLLSDGACEE